MKIKSETFMKKYGTLVHVYSTEISVFHTLRFNSTYSIAATVHWWENFTGIGLN